MRLNKYVAHCGITSRRKAAELVKSGKIEVNGHVLNNPAYVVQPQDKIFYEGKQIKPEKRKVYLLMNKPKDTICTLSDEKNRKTVMDLIPRSIKERIYPVGRLDRATTGLLVLTNDGELAKKLSHPSHKVKKIYHVVLDRPLSNKDLNRIKEGINLEDGRVEVDKISYVQNAPRTEVGVEIHIGRNRIVRRIFEHFDYDVRKLDRVYYGGLTKKDLPRGRSRDLTEQEIIMLKHFS